MNDVEPLELTCRKCGATKNAADFYPYRPTRCKECCRADVIAARNRRREAMGDEVFAAHQREIVRRHREKTNNAHGKALNRARYKAWKRLAEIHADQYEHLLECARREEGL